jgi:hypothetical protein
VAGLIDGEGTFAIEVRGKAGAFFANVCLRADDRPLLDELKNQLGIGNVTETHSPSHKSPQARWQVTRLKELLYLTCLLDRFPLRGKKRHDYAIWRETLLEYMSGGISVARLRSFKAALCSGRSFKAVPRKVQASPQLRLVV